MSLPARESLPKKHMSCIVTKLVDRADTVALWVVAAGNLTNMHRDSANTMKSLKPLAMKMQSVW